MSSTPVLFLLDKRMKNLEIGMGVPNNVGDQNTSLINIIYGKKMGRGAKIVDGTGRG